MAAALDDILGTMVWREAGFSRQGIPTVQLNVRYKNPTPMRRPLRFDTRVVKREGRKVITVYYRAYYDPFSALFDNGGTHQTFFILWYLLGCGTSGLLVQDMKAVEH